MKTVVTFFSRVPQNQVITYWMRLGAMLLLFLNLPVFTYAQNLLWDKAYGGSTLEKLTAMVATPEGGLLLGGYSSSGKSGNKSQNSYGKQDFWLVKTDKAGKKLWDKAYGGSGADHLTSMLATPDGGYLLGGTSGSDNSGNKTSANRGLSDYWLVKVDNEGNKLWERTYGGLSRDSLTTLVASPDGNFLLGGTSNSGQGLGKSQTGFGETDYWLLKIDMEGNKIWDKTFGGSKMDELATIITTQNGGYLLGGTSRSGISGVKSQAALTNSDYWVIRITDNGVKVWDKTYGGATFKIFESNVGYSELSALVGTPDGGFLVGGSSTAAKGADKTEDSKGQSEDDAFVRDYWVLKIDKDGKKMWDNVYTGPINSPPSDETIFFITGDCILKTIVPTGDGNYLLGGYSDAEKGIDKSEDAWFEDPQSRERFDFWVLQIDEEGNKKWDRTIGGLNNEELATVLPLKNGEYVLGGTSASGIGGDRSEASPDQSPNHEQRSDYWVVKIKDEKPLAAQWDMRYGGVGNEGFTTVIKTSDGGYLSGGYSPSGISGDKTLSSRGKNDYWIVKSDASGNKLWDRRYGGSGDDYLNRIIQTLDGGYLLAGSSLSGVSGDKTQTIRGERDYWIVKISNTGVKQWDKRFGGSGYDELRKVVQLSTGEYLLAGFSNSPAGGDKSQGSRGGQDYWLVKVSSTGTKLWDKRYGGSLNETLSGIVQTFDGGYLLGGSSISGSSGDKTEISRGGSDFWLVRTDQNGNKLWDKTYGGSGQDEAYALGKSGSSFFISGQSDSPADGDKTRGSHGGLDYWFIKVTGSGAKVWDKRFGGSAHDELRASIQTSDGGYLLAGKSFSNKSGNKTQLSQGLSDYWIVKTDANGMYQWDKRYGGSGAEELRAVTQTSDGGLLLAGKSDSGVSGDRTQPSQGGMDYWLVKVAPITTNIIAQRDAVMVPVPVVEPEFTPLLAYPNPFNERVRVSFTLPETQPATLKVYDNQGREIATLFQGKAQAYQKYEVEWKAETKATGLYFLQLQTPTKKHQQKLLLNK